MSEWAERQEAARRKEFDEIIEEVLKNTYLKLTHDAYDSDGFRIISDHNRREAPEFMAFYTATTQAAIDTLYREISVGTRYYFFAPGDATPYAVYKDPEYQHFVCKVLDPEPVRPEPPKKPGFFHRVANALTFGRAYKAEMDTYKGDCAMYEAELENYNEKMQDLAPIGELLSQRKTLLQGETREQELGYMAEMERERQRELAAEMEKTPDLKNTHEMWFGDLQKQMNDHGLFISFDGSEQEANRLFFGKAGKEAEPFRVRPGASKTEIAMQAKKMMEQGYRLYAFAPDADVPTAFSMDENGKPKFVHVRQEKPIQVPAPDRAKFKERAKYALAAHEAEVEAKIRAGADPARIRRFDLAHFEVEQDDYYETALVTYQKKYLPIFGQELAEFENAASAVAMRKSVLQDDTVKQAEAGLKERAQAWNAQRKASVSKWSEAAAEQLNLGSNAGLSRVMIVQNGIVRNIPEEVRITTEMLEMDPDKRKRMNAEMAEEVAMKEIAAVAPQKIAEYLANQLENGAQIFITGESEQELQEVRFEEGGTFSKSAPEEGVNVTAAQAYLQEVREEVSRYEAYAAQVEARAKERRLQEQEAEQKAAVVSETLETIYDTEAKISGYKESFVLPNESPVLNEAQGRAIMSVLALQYALQAAEEGVSPLDLAQDAAADMTISIEEGMTGDLGEMIGSMVPQMLGEWDSKGDFASAEWTVSTAMLADINACLELPGVKDAANLSDEMLEALDKAKALSDLSESYRQHSIDLLSGQLGDNSNTLQELIAIQMVRDALSAADSMEEYKAKAADTALYREMMAQKDPQAFANDVVALMKGEKDLHQPAAPERTEIDLTSLPGTQKKAEVPMQRTSSPQAEKKPAELQ